MMNRLMMAVVSGFLCANALAQAPSPRPAGGPISIRVGPGEVTCDYAEVQCFIPVYVKTVSGVCLPSMTIGKIKIPQHQSGQPRKIVVIWHLVETDPNDKHKYTFPADGVVIRGIVDSSGQVIGPNDPTQDFDDNGHADIAKKRFKWRSVHIRPTTAGAELEFSYDVKVQFRRYATASWRPCDAVDPRIINKN